MPTGCCCPQRIASNEDCVQLTPREAQVCITLCSLRSPCLSPSSRQTSGLHQEVLSRIVRRLTIHGLAAKVEGSIKGNAVNN